MRRRKGWRVAGALTVAAIAVVLGVMGVRVRRDEATAREVIASFQALSDQREEVRRETKSWARKEVETYDRLRQREQLASGQVTEQLGAERSRLHRQAVQLRKETATAEARLWKARALRFLRPSVRAELEDAAGVAQECRDVLDAAIEITLPPTRLAGNDGSPASRLYSWTMQLRRYCGAPMPWEGKPASSAAPHDPQRWQGADSRGRIEGATYSVKAEGEWHLSVSGTPTKAGAADIQLWVIVLGPLPEGGSLGSMTVRPQRGPVVMDTPFPAGAYSLTVMQFGRGGCKWRIGLNGARFVGGKGETLGTSVVTEMDTK